MKWIRIFATATLLSLAAQTSLVAVAASEESKTFNGPVGIRTPIRVFSNGEQLIVDPALDVNGDIAITEDPGGLPSLIYGHYDTATSPPTYYPRFKTSVDPTGKSWTLAAFKGGNNWSDAFKVQEGLVGIGSTKPTKNLTIAGGGKGTTLQLNNYATGGRKWNITSVGSESNVPKGSLAIQEEQSGDSFLVISPAGRVGIGAVKPEGLLELYGQGDLIIRSDQEKTGGVAFKNPKGDELGKMYAGSDGLRLRAAAVRPEDVFISAINGNVGIGTNQTPSKLTVVAQTEGIQSTAYRAVVANSNNGYALTAKGGNTGIGVSASGRIGVQSIGTTYDFYAQGSGNNYGPFTGSHEVILPAQGEIMRGMIVSVTGRVHKRLDENGLISLSSSLPEVALSSIEKDAAVFGVFVAESALPESHWYVDRAGRRFGIVNALGEGRVWVSNVNGDIQLGDYVTSSSVPGFGQRQDDDVVHRHTVAKIIEAINWDQVQDTILLGVNRHKIYLAACIYVSG